MKMSGRLLLASAALTALLSITSASAQTAFRAEMFQAFKTLKQATPYQNNNGAVPTKAEYSGPLFVLNHAWPKKSPSPPPRPPLPKLPWRVEINDDRITPKNAPFFAAALKAAVATNARNLIMHYDKWDAAKAGWYNEPWLGSQREAIHGTYKAGDFGPAIFPGTGLEADFDTHVVTYYDSWAAEALRSFWGETSMKPTLTTENARFPEGSIIVKAAVFASKDKTKPLHWWRAMDGAQAWPMFLSVGTIEVKDKDGKTKKVPAPAQVWPGYVAQFDIIVKDSRSSPKTGWIFMTLVYDSTVPGDIWDKMVPLGVEWGNDPQATTAGAPLNENWINPKAPKYATQTLGWGGRLSGPNDGARNDIVYDGKAVKNAPDSGCMSCHSTSEWNAKTHQMASFLLPSYPAQPTAETPPFKTCDADGKPNPNNNGDYICSSAPGSTAWMKWFKNRPGTVAMDAGSFATDFDEVFSFKSLGLWWAATGQTQPGATELFMQLPGHGEHFNLYTGAPLPAKDR